MRRLLFSKSLTTKIILLCCWIIGGQLGAQVPIFTASQHIAGNGDQVIMDISVQNFTNIGTFQFSMEWNPDVLSYQNTANYGFSTFNAFNFGENNTETGLLTTLWFDAALQGESLPDNAILFSLFFEVIGEEGDSSLLEFINAPTAIFVANLNGASIEEVDAIFEEGKVEVISTQLVLTGETTDNQCFGETIGSINIDLIGGLPDYQIEWTGPNNFSSNDLNIDNLSGGTYTVIITDSFGTSVTESFEISTPISPLTVDTIITQQNNCDTPSGEIEVIVLGGTAPYTYDFGTGFSENANAQNLFSGDYPIVILDANNCSLDTMATIGQALPNLIDLGQDTAICSNEDLLLSIENINGTFTWFQDGNDLGNNSNSLEIFETGTYNVQIFNEFGCFSEDSVQVELKELDYTISQDTILFRGMSVPLLATGGLDYFWEPAEFLSCQTCPNPIAEPLTGTYFTVEISTPNGCFASDSVFVDISNELELVIPPVNFISPNGDGKNDRLVFEGLDLFPQNSLIIYNRWGTTIYTAFNYQQNGTFWDATHNGKELPAGAYFYILKVDVNGTEIRTSLTVAR